jgi:hypothetical protein
MIKTAGVITTFARPAYLNRCLLSLENAEGQNEVDWYIFQDGLEGFPTNKVGYYNIFQEDIDENLERIYDSKLNIKVVEVSPINVGINSQMNKAFDLFNDYDRIFFFEDDIVVSKYYLKLLDKCSEQYPEAVVSFFSIGIEKPTKKDYNILIRSTKPRLWGFYMTSLVWEKMCDDWNKKFDETKRTPYYDVTLTRLIRKHSKGKYEPLVTRAYNIGKDGVLSTNEKSWIHRNLHKQKNKIEYKIDSKLNKFILRPKRRGK